jgi:hypothetical protein
MVQNLECLKRYEVRSKEVERQEVERQEAKRQKEKSLILTVVRQVLNVEVSSKAG